MRLLGTIFGRWYVTIFGLVFLREAVRHLGARRTALYAGVAIVVGILAENGSVRIGFPYGYYTFDAALRGRELWVGDVPLMVSLSYTFMWRTSPSPPAVSLSQAHGAPAATHRVSSSRCRSWWRCGRSGSSTR